MTLSNSITTRFISNTGHLLKLILFSVFASTQSEAATIATLTLIDSFNTGAQTLTVSGTGEDTGTIQINSTDIIGNERNARLVVDTNTLDRSASIAINQNGSGALGFSFGPLVSGDVWLTYNGVNGIGLGGVNFLDQDAQVIAIQLDSLDVPLLINIHIEDSLGTQATATVTHPGATFEPSIIGASFSDFDLASTLQFDGIARIQFHIQPQGPGADFSISHIATAQALQIPEPSIGSLLLISLSLPLRWRHRLRWLQR